MSPNLTAIDAMAIGWVVVVFLGLWLIWPALAILTVGVLGLLTVVGLAVAARRPKADK
jgi:hypothetical protein